ncbi:hypothetical protein C8J57DRAFT_1232808 [Mycena rebaudengoi]|nr:hypothetical protein C8J57DRAFT_1232808 [Mycena rebaudengoi]
MSLCGEPKMKPGVLRTNELRTTLLRCREHCSLERRLSWRSMMRSLQKKGKINHWERNQRDGILGIDEERRIDDELAWGTEDEAGVELDIREADMELARGAELLGALLRTDEAREEDERGVELVIWEELEREDTELLGRTLDPLVGIKLDEGRPEETHVPEQSTWFTLEQVRHWLGPAPEQLEQLESQARHDEEAVSKNCVLLHVGRQRPLVRTGRVGGLLIYYVISADAFEAVHFLLRNADWTGHRAYQVQEAAVKDAEPGLDLENRAYIMTITLQQWLAIRLNVLPNLLVFGIDLLANGVKGLPPVLKDVSFNIGVVGRLAFMYKFDFPPFIILIIALLNDATIMTLSVNCVLPSNTPDSWDLVEIFSYAVAYGLYLTLLIVSFVIIILEMTFQDKFGVTPNNIAPNPVDSNDYQPHMIVYLQVGRDHLAGAYLCDALARLLLHGAPIHGVVGAFCIAQLISSIIAAYTDWSFTKIRGISGGWMGMFGLEHLLYWIKFAMKATVIKYLRNRHLTQQAVRYLHIHTLVHNVPLAPPYISPFPVVQDKVVFKPTHKHIYMSF